MTKGKKAAMVFAVALGVVAQLVAAKEKPAAGGSTAKGVFYVYSDKGARVNHFAPSGWMGDYGDIKIDDGSLEDPADGKTCIKVSYNGKAAQGANWAGIYWQHPANNWGDKPGGFDLSNMKRLTFWARGAQGGEKISEFKVGGITGEHGDSDSGSHRSGGSDQGLEEIHHRPGRQEPLAHRGRFLLVCQPG